MTLAQDLPRLMARCDAFHVENRKKAARNLANAEVFLIPEAGQARAYPIYWLLHVRGAGKSFDDSRRSDQNLNAHRPSLSALGYLELQSGDAKFDEAWNLLLEACSALGTQPSNRQGRPRWTGRRIFYPVANVPEAVSPGDAATQTGFEGAKQQVTANRYERDPDLRRRSIDIHKAQDPQNRLRCQVCEMNFAGRYGPAGEGFIHVHHINPLGNSQEAHQVDPGIDLKPVCPNCHAMLHKAPGRTAHDLETVRAWLRDSGYMIGS